MNSWIALGLGFGSLWYWASTVLSLITLSIIAVWFGLVWFGCWDANSKPNQTAQFSAQVIRTHPNQVRFFAVSVWIGLVCGFLLGWFGFEHP